MHFALESAIAGFRASVPTPQGTAVGPDDLSRKPVQGERRDCEQSPKNSYSGRKGWCSMQERWRTPRALRERLKNAGRTSSMKASGFLLDDAARKTL